MYRYELHLHTKETSHCGHVPARDQIRKYHELGYTGVCVTDHLTDKYYDPSLSQKEWNAAMDLHLSGWRAAKKEGDRLGMDVILSAELRFPENNSDYRTRRDRPFHRTSRRSFCALPLRIPRRAQRGGAFRRGHRILRQTHVRLPYQISFVIQSLLRGGKMSRSSEMRVIV